jgi:hypothetical protein
MPQIAIDTNIFLHLLNPQNDAGSHIEQLLIQLQKSNYRLLVDSTDKISNEYQEFLGPLIRSTDDTGIQIFLMRIWMRPELRDSVDLTSTDHLMNSIRNVIPERNEHADRAFVYVACRRNCKLVTNDDTHILPRRTEIRRKTRRDRGSSTDFISSREAWQQIVDEIV